MRVKAPVFAFLALSFLISLNVINPNINSFIVALYGLKIYLFYIPLAFMIPYLFRTEKECISQISIYVLVAIPICLLGIAQFFSPTFSVLNSNNAMEEGAGVVAFSGTSGIDRARITGTFSFIANFGSFLQIFMAMALACISTKEARFRLVILGVVVPLLVANAFMTGSRTAVLIQAICILAFLVGSAFMKVGTAQNITATVVLTLCIVSVAAVYIFSEAVDAFTVRAVYTGETPVDRLSMAWDPLPGALESGKLTGLGIGLTHPASSAVRKAIGAPSPIIGVPVYDAEIPQVLAELGLIGFIVWNAIRLLAFFGTVRSFLDCPPRPIRSLIFAAFLVHGMGLVVSVVLNHTFHFFYWALYGLSLMPSRHSIMPRRRERNAS